MAAPVLGPPARGDDFFDREVEQRRLWRALESDHVLLLSARRVGKTSLLFRLRDTAAEHGFVAAYESMAPAQSELDFVRRLYDAVVKADGNLLQRLTASPVGRSLSRFFPRAVEAAGVSVTFGEGAEEAWSDLGRALATTLTASERRWLLLADEVPVFVLKLLRGPGGRDRAVAFLDWFRDLRQQAPDVRWVLAGSIGLDTLAERHRFTASINDLRIQHLGAFSSEAADAFLEQAGRSVGLDLDPDVRRHLVERVGWPLPYFLSLMVNELLDLRDQGVAVDVDAVDLAFDQLARVERRAYFDHWRQRLHEQLDARDARLAHALLDAACSDPRGASRDTLEQVAAVEDASAETLASLLGLLSNDGYLVEHEERWIFRSPLVREFWRRHACGRRA